MTAIAESQPPQRPLAIVNPGSGRADVARVTEQLRARLPDVAVWETPGEGDLVGLVRAHIDATGPDVVVAVGGDGTVSAVATALTGRDVRLGIIPTGTANVLANELGIPMQLAAACDVVAAGGTRRIDAMHYAGRRCLCRIGVGTFGEVGQQTSAEAKKRAGGLAYVWNALPRAFDPRPRRFALEVDGRRVVLDAATVVVTNLAAVGFGQLRWGPNVRLDDGHADVFVIHAEGLGDGLSVLWNAIRDGASEAAEVSHLCARARVRIELEEDVATVADGEYLPGRVHEVRIEPAALDVLAPPTVLEST